MSLNKKYQSNVYSNSFGLLILSLVSFFKQIYILIKPGVISLVIFTALCSMLIAPSDKSLFIKGISLLLIAVGASGAAILNMWHDRIIDSKMERTKFRPIPSGDISANTALAVGLVFSFMSVVSLFFFTNIQASLLLAFTIIYYSILKPMVNDRKAIYDDKLNKENEIIQFNEEISQFKARIEKIKPVFEKTSTLFHSKAEVEDLYQSLSKFASKNGLVISKLEKKKPVPVLKEGVTDQAAELIQRDMVSYYKIPVDYEIKGNFLGFIKFKRDVARSKKSLNFDKETISVVQNDSTGAVVARGELTIVGLPDEFF